MSFEEEWSYLVSQAEKGQSAATRINHATTPAVGGDGASPDLVVRDDQLGRIGNIAASLFRQIQSAADEAREATFSAATSLTNQDIDMGSGVLSVHDAW
ncbi:hypothetical protein [Streptomyces xiaopingdaonensis]|uniref:hypothetical protein n=1 Tax=Streptomyces xiaopingdaonensis TaxID=1565415 RepID=UPI00037D2093|nr:hypothetical protein [Streptomyces xiaopingdaonensis]